MRMRVHLSLCFCHVQTLFAVAGPSSSRAAPTPSTSDGRPNERPTERASEQTDTESGTRLRAFWTPPIPLRLNVSLLPFTRRLRCLFAAGSLSAPPCKLASNASKQCSAMQRTQCNALRLHLLFTTHYRTLHWLLDFSCASPASPHLPARLPNASPFSSVPRFGSFRREGQPVPRHAAITRLSHARPFSTPTNTNPPRP